MEKKESTLEQIGLFVGYVRRPEKAPRRECQVKLREGCGSFSHKEYDYLTIDPNLQVGDMVVVDTRYGVQIGKVVSFNPATVKGLKFVIQKVDFSAVQEHIQAEVRKTELKAAITKKANEVRKRQELNFLMKQSPELQALVNELQALEAE